MASGRLISTPKRRPTIHPGQLGNCTHPMTKPIAKRLVNAPSRAVFLSGNDIGSIKATSTAPNTSPGIKPRITFDKLASHRNVPYSQHNESSTHGCLVQSLLHH